MVIAWQERCDSGNYRVLFWLQFLAFVGLCDLDTSFPSMPAHLRFVNEIGPGRLVLQLSRLTVDPERTQFWPSCQAR